MTDFSRRPNVLLITAHDLGQHLGCYGVPTVGSTHIDRLAAEGVRFARSFAVAPGCSPSRAAIASGLYPHANGVMGLAHAMFRWDLHPDVTHLQSRFQHAGYRTARCGVVHETHNPDKLGFDDHILPNAPSPETPRAIGLAQGVEQYLADREDDAPPFYLQLGFFEPHRAPLHPTHWPATHRPAPETPPTVAPWIVDDHDARTEFSFFEASIRTLDEAVGQVMASLERHGLAQDTLVIMTSDHGIPFPRAKCSVYEPGLQVPLIMRWPRGPWTPGTVHDAMVSNVDYTPTLCELLDLGEPERCQGVSFAPLLTGQPHTPRTEVFGEHTYHDYYDPLRTIRTETHRLIVAFNYNRDFMDPSQQWRPMTRPISADVRRAGRHPLVQLYDHRDDPLEMHNLADDPEHAELRNQLLARLHAWMVETGDPLLEGPPPSPMHHLAMDLLRSGAGGAGPR